MSTSTRTTEPRPAADTPAPPPSGGPSRRPRRVTAAAVAQYGLLIALAVASFFLIFVMVALSLRRGVDISVDFWHLLSVPYFGNYHSALLKLLPATGRTLFVAAVSIAGILIASTLSAYAFARMRFPGRDLIFYAVLAVMTVPSIILLTPHFVLANQLHLIGSLWGLIVFYIAGGLPFAVFLITTFFRSQPDEIFQAARVDGASELQSLVRIAIPLAFPILVTVAMMNFLSVYGDYIWPTLVLDKSNDTLLMALQSFSPRLDEYVNRPDFGIQSAGYVFATVPQLVVFGFGMKYFIAGVTSGAVKA